MYDDKHVIHNDLSGLLPKNFKIKDLNENLEKVCSDLKFCCCCRKNNLKKVI